MQNPELFLVSKLDQSVFSKNLLRYLYVFTKNYFARWQELYRCGITSFILIVRVADDIMFQEIRTMFCFLVIKMFLFFYVSQKLMRQDSKSLYLFSLLCFVFFCHDYSQ
jgi:hypothetical protein